MGTRVSAGLSLLLYVLVHAFTECDRQGAPIAGWILSAYGGSQAGLVAFRPAIYYAGSLSVAATLLVLAVRQLMLQNWKVFVYA